MPLISKKLKSCQFCIRVRTVLIYLFIVLCLVLVLYFLPKWIQSSQYDTKEKFFKIEYASSQLEKNNYYVNAKLNMEFPEVVQEALTNGVPLIIVIELLVIEKNQWWNDIIKNSLQQFELRYHALTNIYEIKNLSSEHTFTFNTQQSALELLGNIHQAHLISHNKLKTDKHHEIKLRVYMDIWQLPEVLRPVASLSPEWQLDSQWYQWQLN
ncbi:MAG: DUF4390 domain-containing protein [Gammaproteobacteria bacterium]|nr:DUF4390 domain-containing protein [Gammaproteobacteria bacterium]